MSGEQVYGVEQKLHPWRVSVSGWQVFDSSMTGAAVVIVGATEPAEAIVRAVSMCAAMWCPERHVIVELKLVEVSKGKRAHERPWPDSEGTRADVIMAPTPTDRRRVHLVAYACAEVPS